MSINLSDIAGHEEWVAVGLNHVIRDLLEHARQADGRGERLKGRNPGAAAGCEYAAAAYRASAAELRSWADRLRGLDSRRRAATCRRCGKPQDRYIGTDSKLCKACRKAAGREWLAKHEKWLAEMKAASK